MARFMTVDTRTIRKRTYRRIVNPLETLDDLALYKNFRFDKAGIEYLVELLKDDLSPAVCQRGLPIKPQIDIMTTLSYLGSNAFQIKIGNSLGISQANVSQCVKTVTAALAKKLDDFVQFPTTDEAQRCCQAGFFELAQFPGVVSCVDGTHVKVTKPLSDENQYICQKGYHSQNIQVACDYTGKFTNLSTRWPGSTHDSFVMKQSDLWPACEQGQIKGLVLGDLGYMCRPWLLTPYNNPSAVMEKEFNRRQRKTRVLIECSIGRLKKTFNILHQEIRIDLDYVPNLYTQLYHSAEFHQEMTIRDLFVRTENVP